jgi:hypothetical protein
MQPGQPTEGETGIETAIAPQGAADTCTPALIITQPHELPETIQVSTSALRQLLFALTGPQYLIRELQVTRGPLADNPIDKLVSEFNAQIEARRRRHLSSAPAVAAASPTNDEPRT